MPAEGFLFLPFYLFFLFLPINSALYSQSLKMLVLALNPLPDIWGRQRVTLWSWWEGRVPAFHINWFLMSLGWLASLADFVLLCLCALISLYLGPRNKLWGSSDLKTCRLGAFLQRLFCTGWGKGQWGAWGQNSDLAQLVNSDVSSLWETKRILHTCSHTH